MVYHRRLLFLLFMTCMFSHTSDDKKSKVVGMPMLSLLPDDATVTPLHRAAATGQDLTSFLTTDTTVLNAETSSGMTPLHVAIWHNHGSAVAALLQAGANPLIETTRKNATPWHFACRLFCRYDAFLACIEHNVDTRAHGSIDQALKEENLAQQKIIAAQKALSEKELARQKITVVQKKSSKKSFSHSPLAIVCTPHLDCRTKSAKHRAQHIDETKRKIYLLISRGAFIDTRAAEQLLIGFGQPPYGPFLPEEDLLPFTLACHPATKSCKMLPDTIDALHLKTWTQEQKALLCTRKNALLQEVRNIEASLKK